MGRHQSTLTEVEVQPEDDLPARLRLALLVAVLLLAVLRIASRWTISGTEQLQAADENLVTLPLCCG